MGREGSTQVIEFDLYIKGGIDWYSPLVRKLGKEYDTIVSKSGAYYKWLLPGMTYIDKDGSEKSIDTEEGYYDKDLAYIIANSTQAKEAIRTAFEIPGLPSEQEVQEVEKERLNKRKKTKAPEEKGL